MKKKYIVIGITIILLTVIVTTIVIRKNNQKHIMHNGVMLAIMLDGEKITSFPERGSYNIEIDCGDTANGIWLAEEWKLAVEKINGNVTCNIEFKSNPTTLKSKVETVNASQNYDGNGYRYSGKTPNNWVWFNGEKWRIIGSIPICTSSGCATKENLVKIIRSESIGTYVYDAKSSGYTGTWGSNTLYSLLNTSYYATSRAAMNGQNHAGCYSHYNSSYQSRPNCDYTEIGILSSSYYGQMVKNVYWNTGASSNSVTASTAYTNETASRTVLGYVGLMSASDWGYAASSSYHSILMNSYTSSSNNATENSWIFNNGYEWTSIRISSDTTIALGVSILGTMGGNYANNGYAVRPVVYLDSSVYIVSGDGTESNPYQIGM